MREFMTIAEQLAGMALPRASEMPVAAPTPAITLVEELQHVVFKLRAYTDAGDDATAYGVESGMQRAAEMIENLIQRRMIIEGDEGDLVG